ncbi:MAG: glycosyltransferase family 2 protein [Cyanobacteriota bacterium]|nr:glycosyltransferase family 2 protein [Cyanobacteriota bacterium]
MKCPTLQKLPSPPPKKKGWPWTEESSQQSPQLSDRLSDDSEWPKISIVTPSYNQGEFLEETIRSVLLQGYPNLEYIIIDGGSTDNSIEIIRQYEPWLTYWISEPDRGQSDAIQKGFDRSSGQIMGWLNSDDLLEPLALLTLSSIYQPGCHWWKGDAKHILADGTIKTYKQSPLEITRNELLHARLILTQVSTFWTRELWHQAGGYISNLNFAMDYELWLRFSNYTSVTTIESVLGRYRTHDRAKTGTQQGQVLYFQECDRLRQKEYQKQRQGKLQRFFLISFWTRRFLANTYDGWRSWIGRRKIPYV